MKGIKGQLSSLSITDLMQWIDMNKKTGVLFVSNDETGCCFCFEEGRLLIASSRDEGARFADMLVDEGFMSKAQIRSAIEECRLKGETLFANMLDRKLVPQEFLKVCLEQKAEDCVFAILGWEGGTFEFIEELPSFISNSPLALPVNSIVFESVRKYDESKRTQKP